MVAKQKSPAIGEALLVKADDKVSLPEGYGLQPVLKVHHPEGYGL
jgi:hypothetical protein